VAPRLLGVDAVAFSADQFADGHLVCRGSALLDTPANRATFPAEVMAKAVAPEANAGAIASLVSDAAAPVSGAILPVYGA
jgi:hypothetical protein